jgi:hypothetical protein
VGEDPRIDRPVEREDQTPLEALLAETTEERAKPDARPARPRLVTEQAETGSQREAASLSHLVSVVSAYLVDGPTR